MPAVPSPAEPCCEWTDWPARRSPGRTALAVLLLVVAVVATATVDRWLAVVGGAMLLGATAEHLAPTRYRVDEHGATATRLGIARHLSWDRIALASPHPDGWQLQAKGVRRFIARRHDLTLRQPPPAAQASLSERYSAMS